MEISNISIDDRLSMDSGRRTASGKSVGEITFPPPRPEKLEGGGSENVLPNVALVLKASQVAGCGAQQGRAAPREPWASTPPAHDAWATASPGTAPALDGTCNDAAPF
jgi:hypothetical protein